MLTLLLNVMHTSQNGAAPAPEDLTELTAVTPLDGYCLCLQHNLETLILESFILSHLAYLLLVNKKQICQHEQRFSKDRY